MQWNQKCEKLWRWWDQTWQRHIMLLVFCSLASCVCKWAWRTYTALAALLRSIRDDLLLEHEHYVYVCSLHINYWKNIINALIFLFCRNKFYIWNMWGIFSQYSCLNPRLRRPIRLGYNVCTWPADERVLVRFEQPQIELTLNTRTHERSVGFAEAPCSVPVCGMRSWERSPSPFIRSHIITNDTITIRCSDSLMVCPEFPFKFSVDLSFPQINL